MRIGLRFQPEKWHPWVRVLYQGLWFILRLISATLETIAGCLESRLVQVVRIVLTLGLVWFLVKRLHLRPEGVGLTLEEFSHYGHAAITAALVGACMSVLWSSSFCDGLAGIVVFLIDDPDDRPLREDPMDKLDRLVKAGHIRRARWLCRSMIWRRQGSRLALETLLLYLSDRQKQKTVLACRRERISGGK